MSYNCLSCGAEINDSMPRCPYCGTMIAEGAQKEYMQKLSDIREDMEELGSVPAGEVRAEFRRQGRRMRRVIALAVLLTLLLAGLFLWQEKCRDRDNTADYIWENQNFPYMSGLYEAGDYEALLEPVLSAMEEDRSIWNWEYYDEYMRWLEGYDEM